MKKAETTVSNEAAVILPELPVADARGYVTRDDLSAWYEQVRKKVQGGFQRVESRVTEQEAASTGTASAIVEPGTYTWRGYVSGKGWWYTLADGTDNGKTVYAAQPIHLYYNKRLNEAFELKAR